MSLLILGHILDGALIGLLIVLTMAAIEVLLLALDGRPGTIRADWPRFWAMVATGISLGAFWGGLIAWVLSSW